MQPIVKLHLIFSSGENTITTLKAINKRQNSMEKFISEFIDAFFEFGKNYSPIISLLTFFLGLLLGNWLSIGRDKRKEFKEVADSLAKILTEERNNLRPISAIIDFYAFRRILSQRELIRFDKCLEKYEKIKNDAPVDYSKADGPFCGGYPFYRDPIPIIAAIDKLLKFSKRK